LVDSTPFLIINPNADDKRLRKQLPKIHKLAKEIFGDYAFELTTKIGDGIPIARKAKENGYNLLVAIGGDGTLNEVVNVAAETDLLVGMVPGGSACDSHKTHGIPRDFERAFQIIDEGYYERFPMGLAQGDTKRYFIEMINGAFIGETSAALADRFEWAHTEIGYGYAAIRIALEYKPKFSKVVIDDKIVREVNLSCFAVALTDVISDFEMLPGNHPRKGDFAIILVKDLTKWKLVKLVLKATNGKHIPHKNVEILRGKHIVVDSTVPHTWEIEGEIPSKKTTHMEISYIPDVINLIIPKGWKYGMRKKERAKAKKRVQKGLPPFP